VVRVRIDANPAAGVFQFGSGYIISPGLVLTAGHVLSLNRDLPPVRGARCEVLAGLGPWEAGEVVWASSQDRDMALVRVPGIGGNVTPTRFGVLVGTRWLEWRAVGFPAASLTDCGRDKEDAKGEVSPVTQAESGQLGLTIGSREAKSFSPDRTGWAGMSGASVFCGELLVGVITRDSGSYDRSLIATRVDTIARDPALTAILGGELRLEPVTGGLGADIRGCRRRRRFDGLLREEAANFGGRGAALVALRAFLASPGDRGLVVEAPAGYGKTALLANLVGSHRFEHAYHFFLSDDVETVTERGFLANLVEQLAALAGADSDTRFDDIAWLQGLSSELAEALPPGRHALVVDGLDEVPWDAAAYISQLQACGLRTLVSERWTGRRSALGNQRHDSYRLPGLNRDDIVQVLEAVSVSADGDLADLVDDIERVARGTHAEFGGADPFMVRFVAEDLAAGHGSEVRLRQSPPGVEAYIDRWFDAILKSATAHPASLWVVRLLASARGPLGTADLEALVPVFPNQILRPTVSEMVAPMRRHLIEEQAGYRLSHPRLADLVRRRSDADADERRLIEYCQRWPVHRSPYALGYLIGHLLQAGNDDAVWHLLADDDGEGSNPWYLAHLEATAEPPGTGGERSDWLRWYLADLDAMARYAKDLPATEGYRAATIRLRAALVRSTFASIARRIPDDLLRLLVADDIRRVGAAMALAQRRPTAGDRAAALVTVAGAAADPADRRAVVREALRAIAELKPQDRAWHLAALATSLDPAETAEAAELLGPLLSGGGIRAAVALGHRMADDERADFLAMVRASVNTADDAVTREGWLAQLADGPESQSTADAFMAACGALEPGAPAPEGLVEAGLALVGQHPAIAPAVLDLITREEEAKQPALLGRLVGEGPDDAVIPCINALLELQSSTERGSALAVAAGRLDAGNTTALLNGVQWDFDELSLVVPGLREPRRAEAAAAVLGYVSNSETTPATVETIARVVGRVSPYLDGPERTRAVRLLEQCATLAPRVPPHEEFAREVIAMVRITTRDGTPVPSVDWRAGISRADVLTLLAVADQPRASARVEAALRAALAVGDAAPAALLLADLARHATGDAREQLAGAALGAALTLEWQTTLASTLRQIIPALPERLLPQVRDAVRRLADTPERAQEVELMLLAQERPLSAAFIEALPDAAGRLETDALRDILSSAAVDLPEATVESIAAALSSRLEAGQQDNQAAQAVQAAIVQLSRAGRLTLRQADMASRGGYALNTVAVLLPTLEHGERDDLAARVVSWAGSLASAAERISVLGALRPAVSSSTSAGVLAQRLDAELADLDLEALTPKQLAAVVPFVSQPASAMGWRRLLNRCGEVGMYDWADWCVALAASAPTAVLPDMLVSLMPAIPAARRHAVGALSAEIATRGDDAAACDAWTVVLEMAEQNLRPEFLQQLQAALPLATRVLGSDMVPIMADAVQRLRASFP
jgi:hypothetical protein